MCERAKKIKKTINKTSEGDGGRPEGFKETPLCLRRAESTGKRGEQVLF